MVDRRAHRGRPRRAAPAHAEAVQVHAEHGQVPARDQAAAGALQGRPRAAQPGDDEVLPGEQGEPVRLVSPARRAVAGVPGAVLHAPGRPPARHLPGGQPAGHRGSAAVRAGRRRRVPVHPGPDGQGDGRRTGHADHPLRRLAAALDGADVDGDRPHAAHDLPGAAVRLRDLHHQLPGGPARLLDHDELLDDRAADHRPKAPRADATGDARRRTATDVDHGSHAASRQRADDGGGRRQPTRTREPDKVASGSGTGARASSPPKRRPSSPPPPSPRKKKKRSGRRR